MGQIIAGVPYKSQKDPDANEFRNDCGPACVSMILNGLDIPVSTNTVYRKTGAKANQYVSVSQMMRAALTFGVKFEYFCPWDIDQLKLSINAGKAFIPLVHYGAWSQIEPGVSTQSSFTGPHFVVVVGYDDEYIYVNDPLWTGDRRLEGKHKRWTYREFTKAWGTASKDGNRNYGGIYCTQTMPVSTFSGIYQPDSPLFYRYFEIDPRLRNRINAWTAFNKFPIPHLVNPAVVTPYKLALGEWGTKVVSHTVTETDTIPLIALRYYDDPMKWDVIVYFNGMSFTDAIHDGDVLLIPEPLDKVVNIPELEIPKGYVPAVITE